MLNSTITEKLKRGIRLTNLTKTSAPAHQLASSITFYTHAVWQIKICLFYVQYGLFLFVAKIVVACKTGIVKL